jgi:hypothetical protein
MSEEYSVGYSEGYQAGWNAAMDATPPAQPAVQEPVAWILTEELTRRKTTTGAHLWFRDPVNCMWTPVYTAPPAQPAAQEPVADAWMHKDGRLTDAKAKTARVENFHGWRPMAFIASATPPAQPAPEQYTALEQALTRLQKRYAELEAKVAAQPAPVKWSDYEPDGRRYPTVPDAFGTREGEHPQYIQGWNDCRAEMLKGMK